VLVFRTGAVSEQRSAISFSTSALSMRVSSTARRFDLAKLSAVSGERSAGPLDGNAALLQKLIADR